MTNRFLASLGAMAASDRVRRFPGARSIVGEGRNAHL